MCQGTVELQTEVHKVNEDPPVPLAHLARKANLVTTACLDLLDPLVCMATEVTLVHQGCWALQALQDLRAPPA